VNKQNIPGPESRVRSKRRLSAAYFVRGSSGIRVLLAILLHVLVAGCDAAQPAKVRQPAPAGESSCFEAATCGAVKGVVIWEGVAPCVEPYRSVVSPLSDAAPRRELPAWPNVGAPAINAHGGVGQAVVFLRGVDPLRSKPWDHKPVCVEIQDYHVHVHQGEADGRCGFVQCGATVDFVSLQPVFHSLQARGASFFAIPFPAPDRVSRRTIDRPGVVELSSGAGFYWMRGYLIVLDHPYIALTDMWGDFTLEEVPPGKYELVIWHPNWEAANHSRDADTCQICRLTLQPPIEVVRSIEIGPNQTRTVQVHLSAGKPATK
jgi:hypothetical protein